MRSRYPRKSTQEHAGNPERAERRTRRAQEHPCGPILCSSVLREEKRRENRGERREERREKREQGREERREKGEGKREREKERKREREKERENNMKGKRKENNSLVKRAWNWGNQIKSNQIKSNQIKQQNQKSKIKNQNPNETKIGERFSYLIARGSPEESC